MKKMAMLLFFLSSVAIAQNRPQDLLESLTIDGRTQTATAILNHDFGFPNGIKQGMYTFKCPQGKLDVLSYIPEEPSLYSNDQPKVDDKVTKLFINSNLINSKPPYALFKLENGTYKIFCKNGFLINDFSDFAKKNNTMLVKGSSVSFLSDVTYLGRVTLTLPVLNSHVTLVTPKDFKNLDQTRFFALGTSSFMGPDLLADKQGSALFLYQTSSNSLVPLEYDGKLGKGADIYNIQIPNNRMLTFYFTDNYNKDDNWTKIVLDLKNFQTWNEQSTKPKAATIVP